MLPSRYHFRGRSFKHPASGISSSSIGFEGGTSRSDRREGILDYDTEKRVRIHFSCDRVSVEWGGGKEQTAEDGGKGKHERNGDGTARGSAVNSAGTKRFGVIGRNSAD